MIKCDCALFHANGPTDARPSRTASMQGPTAIARQRKLERTGYHRSRSNRVCPLDLCCFRRSLVLSGGHYLCTPLVAANRPNLNSYGLAPKPSPVAKSGVFGVWIMAGITPPEGPQGSQPAHPLWFSPPVGGRRVAWLCQAPRDGDLPSVAVVARLSG